MIKLFDQRRHKADEMTLYADPDLSISKIKSTKNLSYFYLLTYNIFI
jgi:hypothetical protein